MENTFYSIGINSPPFTSDDLVLDISDLEGIVQQLEAIALGYSDDFVCFVVEEREFLSWHAETLKGEEL